MRADDSNMLESFKKYNDYCGNRYPKKNQTHSFKRRDRNLDVIKATYVFIRRTDIITESIGMIPCAILSYGYIHDNVIMKQGVLKHKYNEIHVR